MLEPILLGLKVLFLILLYLFIYRVVRSLARDLSGAAAPPALPPRTVQAGPLPPKPVPPPAAPPPRAARPPRAATPPAARPSAPAGVGKTGEFEYLVAKIQPRLVVQHSKVIDSGKVFKLKGGATIGRSPASDIVLPDDYVSQTHARVFARKQFLYIEDLGSTNGTFIDGRRIEGEHQIKPGQEIVLGDTIFRYEE